MERSDFDFRSVTWKPNDTKGSVSASLNSEVPKRPFPFVYDLLSRIVKQQTGKGKIARIERICIVGNGKGMVGLGIGKDAEGHRALDRARGRAVKNMDFVERFEERTIYTEMQAKLGSTRIIMRPRPVGFGLRCNPYMHQIFRACGIKDISAKVWGSRNPINVMHATLRMLQSGHAPILMGDGLGGPGRKLSKGSGIMSQEAVERSRGRRLATLRKTT
ncbi:ribosomal protein S5 domain 2-like protein [Fistulina hepatica ATCC 64428]|uniref:Ribosomal protein S5 domain 2-like protein n=1 Tax=Fistulina hepatica ATCC 64428 TaxID=1128425 RepID=A0A0D7AAH0_9AGAR|nr:ribosomal protein S5 domain 2-like protein [Fistulina hepatica ATCC 64428]